MINFIPINHISWINKKNYSYALKFFCVNKKFALKNCQVRIISPFFLYLTVSYLALIFYNSASFMQLINEIYF